MGNMGEPMGNIAAPRALKMGNPATSCAARAHVRFPMS